MTEEKEIQQVRLGKRLLKIGGSLVVTLPNEVIQEWNLGKGDEVALEVLDGAVRIEPKQPTKMATISDASLETYSKVMKGIQAKVTMDSEGSALHLEISGEDKDSVNTVLHNLWRNLPFLLNMLGLGSVETSEPLEEKEKRRQHGKSEANQVD